MKKIKTKLVALFALTITPLSAMFYNKTQIQNNNSKTVNKDNNGQLGDLPPADELQMLYPDFPLAGENVVRWHFNKIGQQMFVIAKFYFSAAIIQFYYSDFYRDFENYAAGHLKGESTLSKLLFDNVAMKNYYPAKGQANDIYHNAAQRKEFTQSLNYYSKHDWYKIENAIDSSYYSHTGFVWQTESSWNDGYLYANRAYDTQAPEVLPGDTAYNGENSANGDLAEVGSELNININGPYSQIINDFFSKSSPAQFWNWFSGENGQKPPDSFPLAKQVHNLADIKAHAITGFGMEKTLLPNVNNYLQLKSDIQDPDHENFKKILKGAHDFMYKNGMTIRIKRVSARALGTHTLNFQVIQQPPRLNFVKLHPNYSQFKWYDPISMYTTFHFRAFFDYIDQRELMHKLDGYNPDDYPNAFYNWLTAYQGGGWSHGAELRDKLSQDQLDDLQDYIDSKGDYKTTGLNLINFENRFLDIGLGHSNGMDFDLTLLHNNTITYIKSFNPESWS